ncbi:hypothetical protein HF923_03760 [Acidithiobacillus ferriphilus]|uniref:hypothetical protein n=1 Tax=Acidithiobacillus ferriphilus TaxID=1689834 RepID=UPI001C075599|nr:hypothetical protein [Acidithiobacillus ferriphilus]MBU2844957.1 hypothetical protein [Acidithiobacillus ferriphilus]
MALPVFARIKVEEAYAQRLRVEAAERRLSHAVLATEYVMSGMDAVSSEDVTGLVAFERRIAATILAGRADIEALQAELDTVAAMLDLFVKVMLVHLPEPSGDEKEAIGASALQRYDRFIKQVAETGFDRDRPRAIRKIAILLGQKIAVDEDGGDE